MELFLSQPPLHPEHTRTSVTMLTIWNTHHWIHEAARLVHVGHRHEKKGLEAWARLGNTHQHANKQGAEHF